jgi:hypothetical protein
MGRGVNGIYNLISIIFLILTVFVIIGVAIRMTQPPAPRNQVVAVLPTAIQLPTLTPTEFRPTLPPTFTLTPSYTPTLTATPTLSPTAAPSATITDTPGPTDTPSLTPTLENSPTFTPSPTSDQPSPTWTPSQSPFPFQLRDGQVRFQQNNFNSAGCAWQGIGGQVRNRSGQEIAGWRLVVFDQSQQFRQEVLTGSNTRFGTISGWEVRVADTINTQTYFVQLFNDRAVAMSDIIQVTFPADCARNAAIVDFVQP